MATRRSVLRLGAASVVILAGGAGAWALNAILIEG